MQALEKGVGYLQGESGKKITGRWEGDGLPIWPSSCH